MGKRFVAASLAIFLAVGFRAAPEGSAGKQPEKTVNTFVELVYTELPLGSIKPKGWLLHQLQIMRNGTTGHLDEVYAKVKDDNGWLGGKGDGWEETPYWLDGAVPLAYMPEDKPLREKVLKYIDWTLEHQRPSGYFGPITKAEREGSGLSVTFGDCYPARVNTLSLSSWKLALP